MSESQVEISCRAVLREISNYIEGDLSAELRTRLEAHFRGCDHCRAILDGTGNLLRLVCDGRSFDLPPGFSRRLRERIQSRSSTLQR